MSDLPGANHALRMVGVVIFYWGQIETKLCFDIVSFDPNASGPHVNRDNIARALDRILKDWRKSHLIATADLPKHMSKVDALLKQIKDLSDTRNTICHGFSAILTNTSNHNDTTVCCHYKYLEYRSLNMPINQRFFKLSELKEYVINLECILKDLIDLHSNARVILDGRRISEG